MKAKHYLLLGLLFFFLPTLAPLSYQWWFIPITRDCVLAIHPVFTPLMYLCFGMAVAKYLADRGGRGSAHVFVLGLALLGLAALLLLAGLPLVFLASLVTIALLLAVPVAAYRLYRWLKP
jgi:hypothetical protein